MTPRRLDRDRITETLRSIEQFADDLDPHSGVSSSELEHDRQRRNAIERALIGVVDLAVSLNAHVLAHLGQPHPATYRASFAAMAAADVIPSDLAAVLEPSAGLRNVLVHQYTRIDPAIVAHAATTMPADARRYTSAVAAWLLQQAVE